MSTVKIALCLKLNEGFSAWNSAQPRSKNFREKIAVFNMMHWCTTCKGGKDLKLFPIKGTSLVGNPRICKRRGILFQIYLLLFSTLREYFYSHQTNFNSQPKKSRFKQSSSPYTKPWGELFVWFINFSWIFTKLNEWLCPFITWLQIFSQLC